MAVGIINPQYENNKVPQVRSTERQTVQGRIGDINTALAQLPTGYSKSTTATRNALKNELKTLNNPVQTTGGVGTHTAYETDPYGRRVEVTYDATGKVIGSKGIKRNPDGSYVPTNGTSQYAGVPMNASNWQKLIALLRDKFGISL